MNRSLFIELLDKPQLCGKDHEADLRELLREYPYFQPAHALLTKSLHNQNSYLFEKELRTAALYSGSRRLLYELIHAGARLIEDEAPEAALEEIISIEDPIGEEVVLLPEETLPAPEEFVTGEVLQTDMTEEVPASEPVVDPGAIEQLQESHISASAPELGESGTEVPESIAETNKPHSFDEWLALFSGKSIPPLIVNKPEPEPIPDMPDVESQRKEATDIPEKTKAEPLISKNSAFDSQDIIDRFIKESPSISRPKAEFFNPLSMSKSSVEEDDDLATETLAKIYAKQANHKKAIRIYEKLCLKFPDKMPYFVALIQKIKAEHKLD